jgi:hypothetical protein
MPPKSKSVGRASPASAKASPQAAAAPSSASPVKQIPETAAVITSDAITAPSSKAPAPSESAGSFPLSLPPSENHTLRRACCSMFFLTPPPRSNGLHRLQPIRPRAICLHVIDSSSGTIIAT